MGDGTAHVIVRDLVNIWDGSLVDSAPVLAFRDRIEAECELQRLEDGCRDDVVDVLGKVTMRSEYRMEEVELA